jgi:spore germination protein GerM
MMQKYLKHKTVIRRSLFLTTTIAVTIWAGSLFLTDRHQKSAPPVTTSSTISTAGSAPQVYWLQSDRDRLILVAKSLPANSYNSSSPQQALTIAMQKLLSETPSNGASSTIPKGTKLRSLQVRNDGVHVDLSKEFRAGGGSTSMIYRVAQVIYTATSIDPQAKVFVSVEGKPLDRDNPLGGEGLIIDRPTTRDRFSKDFSLH